MLLIISNLVTDYFNNMFLNYVNIKKYQNNCNDLKIFFVWKKLVILICSFFGKYILFHKSWKDFWRNLNDVHDFKLFYFSKKKLKFKIVVDDLNYGDVCIINHCLYWFQWFSNTVYDSLFNIIFTIFSRLYQ